MALPLASSSAAQNKYSKRGGRSYKCSYHEEHASNDSSITEKTKRYGQAKEGLWTKIIDSRSMAATDGLTEPGGIGNNVRKSNK
jgi:hypothetical protein